MSSEMIDATVITIVYEKIKVEEHYLNLNIKQEAPDETGSEVQIEKHDLNLNIKQEPSHETSSEVEELSLQLAVKREEECSGFGQYSSSGTTLLDLHRENTCALREEKKEVNETDSVLKVEDMKTNKGRLKCVYQTNSPRHFQRHDNERLLDCPHCGYKGLPKTHLLLHLKHSHPNELPHACDSCSFRSSDFSILEKHKQKHKRVMIKCEFCNDFTTTNLIQMRSHKRQLHMRDCPHCNYRSLYKDKLKQHMFMHVTEKILSCANSKYRTKLHYNLDRHPVWNHTAGMTGERPFPCNQCDYRAFQKRDLKTHVLYKHSNERPFKCEVCQKDYVRMADLRIHSLVHLKKKPFCCDECTFSTIYKWCLKNHMRSKHNRILGC